MDLPIGTVIDIDCSIDRDFKVTDGPWTIVEDAGRGSLCRYRVQDKHGDKGWVENEALVAITFQVTGDGIIVPDRHEPLFRGSHAECEAFVKGMNYARN